MRVQIFASLLLCLLGCGQAKKSPVNTVNKISKIDSPSILDKVSPYKKNQKNIPAPTFAKANPAAKLLLNEPFYFSSNDEAGPFGNNDGLITYADFKDWRQTHKTNDLKEFLSEQINDFGYPKFDLAETDILKLTPYLQEHEFGSRFMSGTDAAIVAIAFGQLYLEGTIDKDFKELAKTSLRRQLIPELLAGWGDPYKVERKTKLMKMLAVLSM